MTRWLGIDPGLTGGLALYDTATPHLVLATEIPVAGAEVDTDTLAALICEWQPDVAMIERVSAMPRQGVSSTFKFGAAYGAETNPLQEEARHVA